MTYLEVNLCVYCFLLFFSLLQEDLQYVLETHAKKENYAT